LERDDTFSILIEDRCGDAEDRFQMLTFCGKTEALISWRWMASAPAHIAPTGFRSNRKSFTHDQEKVSIGSEYHSSRNLPERSSLTRPPRILCCSRIISFPFFCCPQLRHHQNMFYDKFTFNATCRREQYESRIDGKLSFIRHERSLMRAMNLIFPSNAPQNYSCVFCDSLHFDF
jgi:hypothetical protein